MSFLEAANQALEKGHLFALKPDGYVLRRRLGTDWTWDTVGSGFASLTSDATGDVYAVNAITGIRYKHVLGADSNWIPA